MKDLTNARLQQGEEIIFEAEDVSIHEVQSNQPSIRYRKDGGAYQVTCDFIAGCDGFHGICRSSIPPELITLYERTYPFAWLGILAEARLLLMN